MRTLLYLVITISAFSSRASELTQLQIKGSDLSWEGLTRDMMGQTERFSVVRWEERWHVYGLLSPVIQGNLFSTSRVGAGVRTYYHNFMWGFQLTHVTTEATDTSQQLTHTQFRQYGQPSHYATSLHIEWPLAQGVAQSRAPLGAGQFVFSLASELRHLYYTQLSEFSIWNLSDDNWRQIHASSPSGMIADTSRLAWGLGARFDLYSLWGFSLSTNIQLLKTPSQTMRPWWEGSFCVGLFL